MTAGGRVLCYPSVEWGRAPWRHKYAYNLACRRGFNRIQNCLAHGQQEFQISISKKRGILGYSR